MKLLQIIRYTSSHILNEIFSVKKIQLLLSSELNEFK